MRREVVTKGTTMPMISLAGHSTSLSVLSWTSITPQMIVLPVDAACVKVVQQSTQLSGYWEGGDLTR